MARKPAIAIQETVETDEDFQHYIETHEGQLICMEVYSEFCGPCLATGNAIRKAKMEIGQDNIAMVRCSADNITVLQRFKHHSEPVFLFIVRRKLIRAMFGPNGIDLCRMVEEELKKNELENEGVPVDRQEFEIHELLPEEAEKLQENLRLEEEYQEAAERLQVLTLAARKKRVNDRLSQKIRRLNFIMFWPHCHKAHYDLYEKWDNINITVAAKESVKMDEDGAREALYMSDVDANEACLHALFDGEALVVLFKMFETDSRDFVKLMRYTLYEDIPVPKEDVPPEKQLPPIPAYERYASISKTAREIRRDRYNAKLQKLQEEREEAERLASEQARLARADAEEEARLEKIRQDEARMARIAAGLPADPVPEPEPKLEPVEEEQKVGEDGEVIEGDVTEGVVKADVKEGDETGGDVPVQAATEGPLTEAAEAPIPTPGEPGVVGEEGPQEEVAAEPVEVVEVFDSDVEVEGEDFIPAGGLFVPGFYTPANELARACGLTYFFPKQVMTIAETMETEFLPPHVLVIFPIDKRYDVMEIVNNYSSEILNMGIFVGDDPYTAEHVAYTIKQYDKIIRPRRYFDRLAVMVSRKKSLTLLQLAGLNPVYISSDVKAGERECLAMFPVGYGDDYVEIESLKEEEEIVVVPPEAVPEIVEVPQETVPVPEIVVVPQETVPVPEIVVVPQETVPEVVEVAAEKVVEEKKEEEPKATL